MGSKITGSAHNIFNLYEAAINKLFDGEETIGIGKSFEELVKVLNDEGYKAAHGSMMAAKHMQRNIYNVAKRLVTEGKGHLGLVYTEPYLNRPSKYVYKKTFVEVYGKFNGHLYDVRQGMEVVPDIADNTEISILLHDLKSLGITGTVNRLSSSQFEPGQCIEQTRHTLFFMGLLGSKWVENQETFTEFLKMVQSKPNGKVRYLLINPLGESFSLLKTMRGEHLKDVSTEIFRGLVDRFRCLEVRFYDFLPCFRLIFIDNKILAASRYKLDENNYIKSKKGWDAPHLVIDAEQGEWSLYEPFLSYYENIWGQSTDIRKIIQIKEA